MFQLCWPEEYFSTTALEAVVGNLLFGSAKMQDSRIQKMGSATKLPFCKDCSCYIELGVLRDKMEDSLPHRKLRKGSTFWPNTQFSHFFRSTVPHGNPYWTSRVGRTPFWRPVVLWATSGACSASLLPACSLDKSGISNLYFMVSCHCLWMSNQFESLPGFLFVASLELWCHIYTWITPSRLGFLSYFWNQIPILVAFSWTCPYSIHFRMVNIYT